jgi:hypothetical protein
MNVEYHITHTAEMVHLVFPYAVRKGSISKFRNIIPASPFTIWKNMLSG